MSDLRARIAARMEEIAGESEMEETMTRSQLTAALKRMNRNRGTWTDSIKFGEYSSAESLAADLFTLKSGADLFAQTTRSDNMENDNSQTLTRTELDQALRDLKLHTVGAHADTIYRRVLVNRDPEWKTGDIVRSHAGNLFQRRADGDWDVMVGINGSRGIVKDGMAVRPLTLVGRAV